MRSDFSIKIIASKERRPFITALHPRQTATILAALLYWREEMIPHGRQIMRPYLRHVGASGLTPLNRRELERLCDRLKAELSSQR
ncbi:MAG: hypothetical protein C0483_10395 [Pirellula sp.]|nr:hypothetical protein [Pirellula sp.]